MPVFISYSHRDHDFVDRLAAHLVRERTHVWVDRWELRVGDSILNRVQEALTSASALLVVLSSASVESEWCKKELTAGLLRELEEKRVVVLPVLLEDCSIPLFLRDKLYADFRTDFEAGLRLVLESVAGVTSDTQGRLVGEESHSDWALDWQTEDGMTRFRVTVVEQAKGQPQTVLTEIAIDPNPVAANRYRQYEEVGLDWVGRQFVLEAVSSLADEPLNLLLDDQFPQSLRRGIGDPKSGIAYEIAVTSRRLGEDNGKTTVVHVSGILEMIREANRQALRQPTAEEVQHLYRLLATRPDA